MKRRIDLTGKTFGRLTVVRPSRGGRGYWMCLCECGVTAEKSGNHLREGSTKSCGCQRSISAIKRATTHGMSLTREYKIWMGIKARCRVETCGNYSRYGGRGVEICDRWHDRFENFYADMGPRPSPRHSVERRDNDGHYEPTNCFWATAKEQAANKRGRVSPWKSGGSCGLLSFGA